MPKAASILLVLICALIICPLTADSNDPSMDDLLGGFEEENQHADEENLGDVLEGSEEQAATQPAPVNLNGYLKFGSAFNFAHKAPKPGDIDWRGISKLRAELQLELEIKTETDWEVFVSGKVPSDLQQAVGR